MPLSGSHQGWGLGGSNVRNLTLVSDKTIRIAHLSWVHYHHSDKMVYIIAPININKHKNWEVLNNFKQDHLDKSKTTNINYQKWSFTRFTDFLMQNKVSLKWNQILIRITILGIIWQFDRIKISRTSFNWVKKNMAYKC